MDDEDFRNRMQVIVDNQAVSTTSPVISQERYDAIWAHLSDRSQKVSPHFRHWVKTKQFQIRDLPYLGLHKVLVVPNNHKNQSEGGSKFLRVVHSRNVYDIVKRIHADELKHCGYKKVMDYVFRYYVGITRGFVQQFCKHCPVCQLGQSQATPPPLPPIAHKNFLERMQVDIIDMTHSPNKDFNYIGHFMDHFSQFHVLFPLKQKSAEEVARMLEERVLAYLGPPKIFHSDDGTEFINQLIAAMFNRWEGDDSAHTQDLIKIGNFAVEQKIAALKQEENIGEDALEYPWASWLPRIMFSMNCVWYETIKGLY